MNNIKIIPYPNYRITDACFERDIKANSEIAQVKPNSGLNFNAPNTTILEFDNGDRRVARLGPSVLVGNEKYCSIFPNPVHLFFDSAITYFRESEKVKATSFPQCANKKNKRIENVRFLDADVDETHQCYNEFFKLRINSIIMLSTSVEAFINHSIPNSYPNREDIERYGKFKEKLTTHLPASLNLTGFWDNKQSLHTAIINLYHLRNDLIHLKTNSEADFVAYFEVINKMLAYDISTDIYNVSCFMNSINPNFIVENKENTL